MESSISENVNIYLKMCEFVTKIQVGRFFKHEIIWSGATMLLCMLLDLDGEAQKRRNEFSVFFQWSIL